jgi:hypothetical protein
MEEIRTFEKYPARMVAVSVLVTISIYALGAMILSGMGPVGAAAYLIYCAAYEIWVMRHSCVNCYYYGKLCGLGRGKISPYFFPKGDPETFVRLKITWRTLIPDLLVLFIPLLVGTIILIQRFSLQFAAVMVLFLVLSLGGNAFVRNQIACKYCKQREIGCPAEQFFGGERTH